MFFTLIDFLKYSITFWSFSMFVFFKKGGENVFYNFLVLIRAHKEFAAFNCKGTAKI